MFYSENLKKIKDIKHGFFSRKNGVSKGIYESLNCGVGSNDKKENVQKNLDIVSKEFGIDRNKLFLMKQTHSNKVKFIESNNTFEKIECDALLTKNNNFAIGVLTADCIPILIYEIESKIIGCIHAGWKGAYNGIIENTLEKLNEIGGRTGKLIVCLGPCISKKNYEVKEDFYLKFKEKSKENDSFFSRKSDNNFNFDLRGFVNKKFRDLGVVEIENVLIDTFAINNNYFSHRRAKKLGENDYGRCISVIKKTSSQN